MLELQNLARDAFGVKSNEVRAKEKRLSDKIDSEGNREFDVVDEGAREVVESAGEGKSIAPIETDRQISQFEGKEAKAKQQEILDIYKKELEPGTDISKTIIFMYKSSHVFTIKTLGLRALILKSMNL